jgi:hypothetical protein
VVFSPSLSLLPRFPEGPSEYVHHLISRRGRMRDSHHRWRRQDRCRPTGEDRHQPGSPV